MKVKHVVNTFYNRVTYEFAKNKRRIRLIYKQILMIHYLRILLFDSQPIQSSVVARKLLMWKDIKSIGDGYQVLCEACC